LGTTRRLLVTAVALIGLVVGPLTPQSLMGQIRQEPPKPVLTVHQKGAADQTTERVVEVWIGKTPGGWYLSISGTNLHCELRSTDPTHLFEIQRQFYEVGFYQGLRFEAMCRNVVSKSPEGNWIVDLDAKTPGSPSFFIRLRAEYR